MSELKEMDLLEVMASAAEELEEAEAKASGKSEELAALRRRLWKLLGPPPGTVEATLESADCSNCVSIGKSALIKELEAICKNITAGHPNAAWGRAAALITMLREGGCHAE